MDSSYISEKISTEVLFQQEIESTEDPVNEWSSLDVNSLNVNAKQTLFEKDLYDPGSGEICGKYIAQSYSDILGHLYCNYPAIHNPGILQALKDPIPPLTYPEDGQQLYLDVCEEMNQCPVRIFYRKLLERHINLEYYGVNPCGIRPMALALSNNTFVTSFNLTDNFLNDDACFHLGKMLAKNSSLVELNLSGCHIGHNGLKILLENMVRNETLKKLNLSKNNLCDDGMVHLAEAVFNGLYVTEIDLSSNDITGRGVASLTEAFEAYNEFTSWNLSWNKLYLPGTYNFLTSLSETTKNLKEINLSWNNLFGSRVAMGIRNLLNIPSLETLDLSNNRLEGAVLADILANLKSAKNLITFNLSSNPLSTQDARLALRKLKLSTVKVLNLYMDNISVTPKFLQLLDEIKLIKPQITVTYGDVIGSFKPVDLDIRDLVLSRVEYLCKRSKKKIDFALIALKLHKEKMMRLSTKEFIAIVKTDFRAPLNEDLIEEVVHAFPGDPERVTIDIGLLVDYIRRKWPNKHLPPTPPPEPEPEPLLPTPPLPTPHKRKTKARNYR